MKTQRINLMALLFLLGLGLFSTPEVVISETYADDEGIIIEDEGEIDSSSLTDEYAENESEPYPTSETDD